MSLEAGKTACGDQRDELNLAAFPCKPQQKEKNDRRSPPRCKITNLRRGSLTKTVRFLFEHQWSILHSWFGTQFFTSDDPVVRLNYHSHSQFDFGGGWGSIGTEIFLPLTPRHLLYTKIGTRTEPRGVILSDGETHRFRNMIAKHAHRSIFASVQDSEISKLHPRTVNARQVKEEQDQWQRWHEEQSQAEEKLMSDPPPSKRPS